MRRSRNYSFEKNDGRKFEVVVYAEDYKELCAHVLRKPNIETGGDLFGLWVDEYKAVVQLALGPGQRCRRTSVSFFQDVKYLEKVGSYLTQHEGLCHIGEWHSHHQLGLARPSGGDENTVWNNMPAYKLSKFVIFIANIEASQKSYKVNIGCFLFEIDSKGNELPVLQGEFKILDSENPFSRKEGVSHSKENEAEKLRSDEKNVNIKDLRLETVKGKLSSVTIKRVVNPSKYDNSNQPENPKKSRPTWNSREERSGAGTAKVQEVNVKSGHPQYCSNTDKEGNPDLDPEMWRSRNYSFEKNRDRKFEVVIYEEDYKELCAHVLRKPNIETGGDLFGLWVDEYKAVVQLALGPGQRCRRTSVSFFQDVKYLEKVGSYLTQHEGLCHIGEWHSHHQLGLARPSGGDENTVWNNMPAYKLSKFVIFIANIEASHKSYKVNIGCFLFEIDSKGNELPVLQGEFKILDSENPFSRKEGVSHSKENEAEKLRSDEKNVNIKDLRLETVKGKLPSVTIKRVVNPSKYDNSNQPENPKKSRPTWNSREERSGAGTAKVPEVNVKSGHPQDSSSTATEGNPDLDNRPSEINSIGATQGRPQQDEKPGGSGASGHAAKAGTTAKGGGKPASVPGKLKGVAAKKTTTASKNYPSNKRNQRGEKQGK